MIYCHRGLRYSTPKLHLAALIANLILVSQGTVYLVTLALQLMLLLAALLGAVVPFKPLLIARYYVLTTASIGAGLWDYLRHGTPAGWAPPEGTR
jgi:hypothetical protein